MRKTTIEEIEHRWSYADLTGATISLAGSRQPGTTVHALRRAPEDVAWLLGRVRQLETMLEARNPMP